MIKVYVRDETGDNSQLLGEFEPVEIPQLPNLFKTFTTRVTKTGDAGQCIQAEFVVDNDETFFEIVVGLL